MSEWLHRGLREAGIPVVCIETRHAQRFLSSRAVNTDKNDARGIAEMMRLGHNRPVHVKSPAAQSMRRNHTLPASDKVRIGFTADAGNAAVVCHVSVEALEAQFGLRGHPPQKALPTYERNREAIQRAASAKYRQGGVVLVASDFARRERGQRSRLACRRSGAPEQ